MFSVYHKLTQPLSMLHTFVAHDSRAGRRYSGGPCKSGSEPYVLYGVEQMQLTDTGNIHRQRTQETNTGIAGRLGG